MFKQSYQHSYQFYSCQQAVLAVCSSIAILISSLTIQSRITRAQQIEPQLAAGALDASFGNAGRITTDFFGNTDEATCMAVLDDGKIVVAGEARSGSTDTTDFALARYNPNGTLDASFGEEGKVSTDFFQRAEGVTAMALQADGRVVVAGVASPNAGAALFAVARYNTDGSLDAGFGSGGKVSLNASTAPVDFATAVVIHAFAKEEKTGMRQNGSYRFVIESSAALGVLGRLHSRL
jgi:uncharacterized delta-60 repeat protein